MKKRKKESKKQELARWRNFAKMRVKGALSLGSMLAQTNASSINKAAREEIKMACQHLQWAIDEWDGVKDES